MIDRYTRPEMAALWTKQKKFETWLEVELNATDAWVKLGKVPAEAAAEMRKNAKFTVERVEEIEQSTRHDVVAFTRCVAESLGEESKYLHFGLTSTDVVDTALSSIVSQALDIIEADMRRFIDVLAAQAVKYKMTPCMGRTHGVHAEPTTLGLKFALWYAEMQRNLERMEHAHKITRVGKISGAVGTYANVDPFVEKYVCEQMGLEPSPISTQVLQRDRAAERHRHHRLQLGKVRHRGARSAKDRAARGGGAVPRGAEGFFRHAAQAQPDQLRKGLRPLPRAARLRAGGDGGRGALA